MDKDEAILEEVARTAADRGGRMVVITIATQMPAEVAEEYKAVFGALGVREVEVLDIRTREAAFDPENIGKVEQAGVLFFTGGDQLRITSQFGGTPLCAKMQACYDAGSTIAGTSAGAAAMPETMLVAGPGNETTAFSALGMAPGLGLLPGFVVDTHFAERGRIGRLVTAIAQNPRNLGLGIDENTAAIIEGDTCLRVIGAGAVYVVDGSTITWSSLAEGEPADEEQVGDFVGVRNVTLHMLAAGERYDWKEHPAAIRH